MFLSTSTFVHAPPLIANKFLALRGAPLCDCLRLLSRLQVMERFTGHFYTQTAEHIDRRTHLQSVLIASSMHVLDTLVAAAALSRLQLSVEQQKRL